MFQAVDKMKLFNWLRRRGGNHQSSSNTTPDAVVAEKSVPATQKKPSMDRILNHHGFTSLPSSIPAKPPLLDDTSLSTSPRHARWLKKVPDSRKGSPTRGSISSLPDWSNDVDVNLSMQLQQQQQQQRGGTFSTMGSPWNSKAAHSSSFSFDHHPSNSSTNGGGHSYHQCHNSYRRRRKYKQGHWVTTDTDYVVLEL